MSKDEQKQLENTNASQNVNVKQALANYQRMKNDPQAKFADDITFGITQTAACTTIDLVGDPHIGGKVQDYLDRANKGKEIHAYKAEVLGDLSGLAIFLGIQKYAPGLTEGIKHVMTPLLNPIYEKIGNSRLQNWAKRHSVDPKSDDFRKKLDEFKDIQANNFARTAVLSTASVVTNVALQKAFHNPRSVGVIAAGKITGATVTMGATLALRAFAPRTMHHIDKRINEHVATPLINQAHNLLGLEAKPAADVDENGITQNFEPIKRDKASLKKLPATPRTESYIKKIKAETENAPAPVR